MPLTRSQIEAAKPSDKRYRLTDGGGLVLSVETSGRKAWRFRYQREGKDAIVTLGHYPVMTLLAARAKALALKQGQGAGHDPAVEKRRETERQRTAPDETFEAVARAYIKREKPHWADSHFKRFTNRMQIDVFPVIGQMHPGTIKAVDVTRAVAGIEERGAQNTANRTVAMVGQVLRYAVAKGYAEQDVTQHLKGGLDRPPPKRHMPAVTDRAEVGQLLSDIWNWPGDSYGKPLLQLCALLFQRPGEIRSMRWADVDLDAGLWTYRVSKVGVDHAVPLPRQAVEILRALHVGTGNRPFVFYNPAAASGHVSDLISNKLLAKLGWKGRQSTHGFRAVARTLIAEDLKVEPRFIEQQLSHTVAEAHGRAYNRTLHLEERAEMLQRYADHLDDLRVNAK